MDLDAIRHRLAREGGTWKTLDELSGGDELRRWLDDEFPDRQIPTTATRRDVLRLMGASLALASLTGCRGLFMPQRHLVPYVDGPPQTTYGKPVTYRSTLVRHGYGFGVEVATRDGRPIKIEGNPAHPASRGATDAIAQASLLGFYDPDRSRAPTYAGDEDTWDAFFAMAQEHLGSGLRVLTETVTSPTLARQIAALEKRVPGMRWHAYEPINRDLAYEASRLAFGRTLAPVYAMADAEVVLGIGFDLDRPELGRLNDAREMAGAEKRVYSVASTPTMMHPLADHVRPMSPSDIGRFVGALAAAVGAGRAGVEIDGWTRAVANDLLRTRGRCVVAVGEDQPPEVQATGYAINAALGNLGKTLSFVTPVERSPLDQEASIASLMAAMGRGEVGCLLVLGGNPAYHVRGFAEAMKGVGFAAHHGLYADETARLCHWHLPAAHEFEAWSDAVAYEGTPSIIQPQIQPIFAGRSAHDLLSGLLEERTHGLAAVRETWKAMGPEAWTEALRTGVAGPQAATVVPSLRGGSAAGIPTERGATAIFRADPTVGDGRWANNGWLQEAPKPHTGLVWDNAVLLSPATAQSLGLEDGDHVEVAVGTGRIVGPAMMVPGHAPDCATLHLGGGRRAAGTVGDEVGYDAFALLPPGSYHAPATLRKVAGHTDLVVTQSHHRMEGRDLVQTVAPGGALTQTPPSYGFDTLTAKNNALPGLPQWGMTIDLDRCIGCNACVVACQAENNISTVGKEEVRRGREMHWIRIDRYYSGKSLDNPEVLLQPVTCMHCETAPCEPVCPVAATVHSHEGINQMVYNRCVGTRYCSNNCPYKVRRFNYLNFQLQQPNFREERGIQLLKLLNNPDVTVRSRGVMEKCTYCLQRIAAARIGAELEGREIADGDVVTACQQACPTKTITFGDLTDAKSAIRKQKADPRSYPLLPEQQTVPRTTYLARVHNPNPEVPLD